MQQNSDARTTLWNVTESGTTLVKTIPGLPVGKPQIGARVSHPEVGNAICIGTETRGSGPDAEVYEVKLKTEA
jgi:hypothetical protein